MIKHNFLPNNLCDELVSTSGNNISAYEKALGFDIGHFEDGGGLIRIDIADIQDLNLRLPSGNEYGANSHWVPGGYTDDGIAEAVSDLIPNKPDVVTITELNK